jgi:hypothetical protein
MNVGIVALRLLIGIWRWNLRFLLLLHPKLLGTICYHLEALLLLICRHFHCFFFLDFALSSAGMLQIKLHQLETQHFWIAYHGVRSDSCFILYIIIDQLNKIMNLLHSFVFVSWVTINNFCHIVHAVKRRELLIVTQRTKTNEWRRFIILFSWSMIIYRMKQESLRTP